MSAYKLDSSSDQQTKLYWNILLWVRLRHTTRSLTCGPKVQDNLWHPRSEVYRRMGFDLEFLADRTQRDQRYSGWDSSI